MSDFDCDPDFVFLSALPPACRQAGDACGTVSVDVRLACACPARRQAGEGLGVK